MDQTQMTIAAVVALWGALVWLVRQTLGDARDAEKQRSVDAALAQAALVEHMDRALASCAEERNTYVALVQGVLEKMNHTLEEHTTYSKQHYHEHEKHAIEHENLLETVRMKS